MNKKFLSLVLALVMVLGAFTSVFAADAVDTKEVPKLTSNDAKIQWLVDNEIVIGRKVNEKAEDNDLALTKTIQRAEVTKLLVYAVGKADLAERLFGLVNPYTDVAKDYWANGYITVGTTSVAKNGLAFLNGYPDKSFKPMNNVTYAELAKMLVVLADKNLTKAQHDAYNANWPSAWIVKATEMGIFEGVTNVNAKDDVVRSNGFVMMYNAFYAMKDIRVLPVNETIGVISKRSDGTTLTLNQGDFQKEFKVDKNTVFVNAFDKGEKTPVPWFDFSKSLAEQNYFVGSLVRVLVQDGVVTHIVELGNPDKGVKFDTEAWKGILADNEVDKGLANFGYVIEKDGKYTLGTGMGKVNLTSATRYFVADYGDNALTEVKDFASIKDNIKYTEDGNGKKTVGYVGYNVLPNSGVKEAKIVVFSDVKSTNTDATLVRVNAPVTNGSFNLPAQTPGLTATPVVNYNLRNVTSMFPYNYNLEKYDVLELTANANNDVRTWGALKIDYSKHNIYKVVEINKGTVDSLQTVPTQQVNEFVLEDAAGYRAKVDLPTDYDAFFTNEIKVGAFVQLTAKHSDDVDKPFSIAEIVSVVPATAPRGEFTKDFGAIRTGLQKVKVVNVIENSQGSEFTSTVVVSPIVKGTDGKEYVSNATMTYVTNLSTLVKGKAYEVKVDAAYNQNHMYGNIVEATEYATEAVTEAAVY